MDYDSTALTTELIRHEADNYAAADWWCQAVLQQLTRHEDMPMSEFVTRLDFRLGYRW